MSPVASASPPSLEHPNPESTPTGPSSSILDDPKPTIEFGVPLSDPAPGPNLVPLLERPPSPAQAPPDVSPVPDVLLMLASVAIDDEESSFPPRFEASRQPGVSPPPPCEQAPAQDETPSPSTTPRNKDEPFEATVTAASSPLSSTYDTSTNQDTIVDDAGPPSCGPTRRHSKSRAGPKVPWEASDTQRIVIRIDAHLCSVKTEKSLPGDSFLESLLPEFPGRSRAALLAKYNKEMMRSGNSCFWILYVLRRLRECTERREFTWEEEKRFAHLLRDRFADEISWNDFAAEHAASFPGWPTIELRQAYLAQLGHPNRASRRRLPRVR